jgi:hypothetical protein
MTALEMCAYLDTKNVPRCSAKRSGCSTCGDTFARSGGRSARIAAVQDGTRTVRDVLDCAPAALARMASTKRVHTGVRRDHHRVVCLRVAAAP